jgi:hypothetical protein
MLQLDIAHTHTPHPRAHRRLGALLARHLRGLLHHVDSSTIRKATARGSPIELYQATAARSAFGCGGARVADGRGGLPWHSQELVDRIKRAQKEWAIAESDSTTQHP